jgi:hypothetical protein
VFDILLAAKRSASRSGCLANKYMGRLLHFCAKGEAFLTEMIKKLLTECSFICKININGNYENFLCCGNKFAGKAGEGERR